MERAGIPRKVAMSISGHKTEAIYRRYDIVSPQDSRSRRRRWKNTWEELRSGSNTPVATESPGKTGDSIKIQ